MSSSNDLQLKLAKLSIEHTKGKPRRKNQPRSKTQSVPPSKEPRSERPNKHSDRVAWNEHFESAIARKYAAFKDGSFQGSFIMEKSPQVQNAALALGLANAHQENACRTKELVHEEGELIRLALELFLFGEFEQRWKELEMKKKEEIVLEGLYRGACFAPRDNSRVSCPEMTIEGLVGDGEYNLINMLKRIVDCEYTGIHGPVKEIYLFPHPWVERETQVSEAASDLIKSYVYGVILLRVWYIVATLQGILEAYSGHGPRTLVPTMTSAAQYKPFSKEQRQAQQQIREDHQSGLSYVDESQCREEVPNKLYACYNCYSTSKVRDGLKRCSECKLVWYCSAKCQSKDWEDHKKYCGKKTFDPKIYTPTTKRESLETFIGCPDPAPGFIRTAALRRQIWYLSKADSQNRDYHFNLAAEHTRSTAIRNPLIRLMFLVARRRAMASGSIPAVWMMYKIVEDEIRLGFFILPEGVLQRQFEMEYGVIITPSLVQSAEPWVEPTAQECLDEKAYLEQRAASVESQKIED